MKSREGEGNGVDVRPLDTGRTGLSTESGNSRKPLSANHKHEAQTGVHLLLMEQRNNYSFGSRATNISLCKSYAKIYKITSALNCHH
jgi:hypothetical protein